MPRQGLNCSNDGRGGRILPNLKHLPAHESSPSLFPWLKENDWQAQALTMRSLKSFTLDVNSDLNAL